MAINSLKPGFVLLCLFIATVLSVRDKTKFFCGVCNKCCQKKEESTRKSSADGNFVENCFGISLERTAVLCSSCRRALCSYKATGKTFFHVSIFKKEEIKKLGII